MLGGVAGYYVVTPLIIGDGLPAVLIERGWKARSAGEGTEHGGTASGAGDRRRTGRSSANDTAGTGQRAEAEVPGIWQNLDYDAYEKLTKRSVARFVVRQAASRAPMRPIACGTNGHNPASGVERHRGYAFQWYALAGLISALAGYFGWKTWRGR